MVGRPRQQGNKDLPDGLYRRPSGTFYVKHPLTGVQVSLETKDKALALVVFGKLKESWQDAVLEARADNIAQKLKRAPVRAGALTAADYLKSYRLNKLPNAIGRNGKPLAEGTRDDYERMLRNQLEPAEAFQKELDRMEAQDIRRFLAPWIGKPNHYNCLMAILSRSFKEAFDEGLIRANPMRDINRRTTRKREVYTPDQHYAAITALLPDWQARALDLVYLVSHRPGTVLWLQERDVSYFMDDKGRRWLMLTFTATKNEQAMEIIDRAGGDLDATLAWFRAWKAEQRIVSPHLIVYPRTARKRDIGRPVSVDYLSRRFAEAVVAAGLPKGAYTVRDLRKKGLTDEARLAGEATNKGGHKTEQMKQYYVVGGLPVRAQNNLRAIDRGKKEGSAG